MSVTSTQVQPSLSYVSSVEGGDFDCLVVVLSSASLAEDFPGAPPTPLHTRTSYSLVPNVRAGKEAAVLASKVDKRVGSTQQPTIHYTDKAFGGRLILTYTGTFFFFLILPWLLTQRQGSLCHDTADVRLFEKVGSLPQSSDVLISHFRRCEAQ